MAARVDLHSAAVRSAARGWAVLPCHTPVDGGCSCSKPDCSAPGKHPRLVNGLNGASTDRAAIEQWWNRWPEANIGIRTGEASGLVVVDIDRRSGGDRTLSQLVDQNDKLPSTLAVRTGDGVHLYFAHPGWPVRNDAGRRLGPGIDVRGEGGYVLAPPSLHACGLRYEAIDSDAPLATMPTWMGALVATPHRVEPIRRVAGLVHDPSAWAQAALTGEVRAVARAETGTRNASLNRAAFCLGQIVAGGGLDNDVVERALLDAAMAAGLSDREARATIASGLSAGAEQPRTPTQSRAPTPSTPTSPQPGAPTLTFVPWPKDFDGPSFGARSDYVEQCWTSVLGPTSVLALRAIAQQLESAGGPAQIDTEQLGQSLGVGAGGRHSVMQRTLGRLEQFGLAIALPDGSMAMRTELPPLRASQLRRSSPAVRQSHERLCPTTSVTRTLTR